MKNLIAPHSFLLGACLVFGAVEGAWAAPPDIEEVRSLMASGQVAAAKEKLIACADRQSPECQFLLADWVERGELFQRDIEAARKLYELAYSGGYEPAGAAILRLAKGLRAETSATTSLPAKRIPEPTSNPAGPTVSSKAVPEPAASSAELPFPLAPGSALPEIRRQANAIPLNPAFAKAPPLAGFRLGEIDMKAFARLGNGSCDRPADSVVRRCVGRTVLQGEPVEVRLALFVGRVDEIELSGASAASCTRLRELAHQSYGRPYKPGFVYKALFGKLVGAKRQDVPDFEVWGRRKGWTVGFIPPQDTVQECFLAIAV